MKFIWLAGLLLPVAFGAVAAGPPHPFTGRVFNTVDKGWLNYECQLPVNGLMTCEFTQVSVRRSLKLEEIDGRLAEDLKGWMADLKKPSGDLKEFCEAMSGLDDLLDGKDVPGAAVEVKQSLSAMEEFERRDLKSTTAAAGELCSDPTEDAVRRFIRLTLETQSRTCEIGVNPFKQTFHAVFASDGKFISWNVADTTPQGDCGLIQLSRFEPVVEKPGEKPYFWRYYARKAIANPQAKSLGVMACSDFDQGEYLYDWKQQTLALQCDYIKAGW